MTGKIFNIQNYSTDDGPGIRTTVFLKGCPLECAWCHNPEGKRVETEIAYNSRKCINCGACTKVCPNGCHNMVDGLHHFTRKNCDGCRACISACPGALESTGRIVDTEDVFSLIERNRPFYGSNGGITLSGGEPLMQPMFAEALLRRCREAGIHTCIETSGYAPLQALERVARYTDLFLFDWKLGDEQEHIRYTGRSNRPIRENLMQLAKEGARIVLRCPVIPDVNDTPLHYASIVETANNTGALRVDVLPYHDVYTGKAEAYGMPPLRRFRVPETEEVMQWINAIQNKTRVPVKRG